MSEDIVLDASALLALMDDEPGQRAVAATLPGALISAVNLAEVVSKLAERGMPAERAHARALAVGIRVIAFDSDQARSVGALRPQTKAAGLSFGDRCCLALAKRLDALVLTTDRRWTDVGPAVGVRVRAIRSTTPRH
jgi:ribonuclease VapC